MSLNVLGAKTRDRLFPRRRSRVLEIQAEPPFPRMVFLLVIKERKTDQTLSPVAIRLCYNAAPCSPEQGTSKAISGHFRPRRVVFSYGDQSRPFRAQALGFVEGNCSLLCKS